MMPEKIIDLLHRTGGGILVIFAVLMGAYVTVLVLREIRKEKEKSQETSQQSEGNPAGESSQEDAG